ncbi:MAG: endonuclease domain-containing protein [Ruminococcaceae bacterium]|nr:endonuclease domain-containing protein [Oscillospiraceae bacterium]
MKNKNPDITHTLVDRARNMRKEPTEEENKLWHLYLKKIRPRFTRQKIIGSYIVDFYCPKLKIVIEIDGVQHYLEENTDYEKRRESYLQNDGYKLLRFYNSDINKDLKNTETTIYYTCVERGKELGVNVTFNEEKQ